MHEALGSISSTTETSKQTSHLKLAVNNYYTALAAVQLRLVISTNASKIIPFLF
jgi:hypothetical protein